LVFHIDLDGEPELEKEIRITCHWPNNSTDTAREKITLIDPPHKMCWEYQEVPTWLLSTSRCITITDEVNSRDDAQENASEVTHSKPSAAGATGILKISNIEIFGGPLAPIVMALKGFVIKDGFRLFGEALAAKARSVEIDSIMTTAHEALEARA